MLAELRHYWSIRSTAELEGQPESHDRCFAALNMTNSVILSVSEAVVLWVPHASVRHCPAATPVGYRMTSAGIPRTHLLPTAGGRITTLLDGDLRTGGFHLLLDGFGFGLGGAFLDGFGRAFDEVLRFLQAQACD